MTLDTLITDVPLIMATVIMTLTGFVLCRIAYLSWKEKRIKRQSRHGVNQDV